MKQFFYGVIEGFYGRQWSWADRESSADFLAQYGFDCYIYAPKGDVKLRSQWRAPHSNDDIQHLCKMGQRYRDAKVRWGVGLSPLGLAQHYGAADRQQLREKIHTLNAMSVDILCILFDDIRGNINDLAARQIDIVGDILAVSQAESHIVCPTYYSFDPVLETVFGSMPAAYLETLGQNLSADIDIFWTGNQVISQQYTQDDIARAANVLNRPPVLWDNYPVNDGKLTSNYLHLRPYDGRPYQLRDWCNGHIVNPMNQAHLSRLVLQSLQQVYQCNNSYDVEKIFSYGLNSLLTEPLAQKIKEDWIIFNNEGLTSLSASQREMLKRQYSQFNEPVAFEIIDWLNEGYQFDPQCLTDQ